MKISARNVFPGNIVAIRPGPVNAEVELATAGGDRIVAIVTEGSLASLGLALGKPAVAVVKAPWVMVMTGGGTLRFSARNQLAGVVESLGKGQINSDVAIRLPGGSLIHAVITNEAVLELGLTAGMPATALIKASHVMLAVPG